MKLISKFSILVMLLLILGCSKGFYYHPQSNIKYESRVPESQILVLFDNPKEPYDTIGLLDYDFYRPGFASPMISEAIPSLRAKVFKVGGDAIIIRDTKTGLGWERNLRITGDVIRYK